MSDILEQITYAIVDADEQDEAEENELFERMADFILTLEPDQLDDEQLEEVIELLTIIDPETFDAGMKAPSLVFTAVLEEYTEEDKERNKEYYRKNKKKYRKRFYPRAEKTKPIDKFQERVYKRKRRQKIKIQKRKLKRSAEGRKRIRIKDRLENIHKTPTERKKLRYNPVRKKRAKNFKTSAKPTKDIKLKSIDKKPKIEKTKAEIEQERFEKEVLGGDTLKIKKAQEKAKALELKKKSQELAKKKKQISIRKTLDAQRKRAEALAKKKRQAIGKKK